MGQNGLAKNRETLAIEIGPRARKNRNLHRSGKTV